ncbi:cytochrome P450 monooxygenase pc-2 [Crepidotus variabilis]|uniref:Cytochrome P450 monooxygenase pc-2 n=1 Tax=Crepidotus variabilis TaxID=179855 RepID=A0A9P6EE78_9AGAR|nr:cytochrome P450 monooxygenase pc-2 [Crepidotus variabilis]
MPPGVKYLIERAPKLLFGPILAFVLIYIAQSYLNFTFSTTRTWLWVLLSGPFLFSILLGLDDIKNYLAARSMGAILPPFTDDLSPGGIWSILKEIRNAENGYIAEDLENMTAFTLNLRMLFQNRMVTTEPEHIKSILSTEFDRYEKGEEIRQVLGPLLGNGVFNTDGRQRIQILFHRSITRPFFTKDRISHFDNFERHANDVLHQIKTRLREGYPVDIQDAVGRFAIDSACEFLFGNDIRSLSSGLPYPQSSALHRVYEDSAKDDVATLFSLAFSKAQQILLYRIRLGLHWPLTEFWKDELQEQKSTIYALIDPIVKEAVRRRQQRTVRPYSEGTSKVEDEITLLDHLVNSTDDPVMLRDEIMNLLVAGRDTTSSTLSFVIYMLALNPPVLDRLRKEILQRVGLSRRPDYDDVKEMKYLRAVINETLRLYPPVPFNLRMSKQASLWPPTLPGGKPYYIPANTRIGYTVLGMHRRVDLWGPDALDFDPDRFLDDRLQKYLTPNPFIFLPFNAGPRICLGQQFAYNEVSFFIIKLLQSFSGIELAEDAQPIRSRAPAAWATEPGRKAKEKLRPKSHLTMYLDGGLWVKLTESLVD